MSIKPCCAKESCKCKECLACRQYVQWNVLHLQGKMHESLPFLKASAKAGNATSAFNLAVMYSNGSDGVPKDDTKSITWMKRSLALGAGAAAAGLGDFYANGMCGISVDLTEARKMYELAIERKYMRAYASLGALLMRERNYELAKQVLQCGAEAGSSLAYERLSGLLEITGDSPNAFKAVEHGAALEIMNLSLDQSMHHACVLRMARCCRLGIGTEVNLAFARALYQKAFHMGQIEEEMAENLIRHGFLEPVTETARLTSGKKESKQCGKCCTVKAGKMLVCGACKEQYYCDRKCQVEDWTRHKIECKIAQKRKENVA